MTPRPVNDICQCVMIHDRSTCASISRRSRTCCLTVLTSNERSCGICIISTGIVYWQKQQQHKWQVGVAAPAIQTSTHKSQPLPPDLVHPLPPHSPPPPPPTHEPPHLQLANSAPTNVGVGCARLSSWLEITAHFEQVLQTNFPKIEITFDYHGSVDSFPKAESIRHQTMVQLLLYFSASSQCNFIDQMARKGARSKCVPFKFYNPPSFLFYHLLQISRSLSLFAM